RVRRAGGQPVEAEAAQPQDSRIQVALRDALGELPARRAAALRGGDPAGAALSALPDDVLARACDARPWVVQASRPPVLRTIATVLLITFAGVLACTRAVFRRGHRLI